jgi:hypothetical protein
MQGETEIPLVYPPHKVITAVAAQGVVVEQVRLVQRVPQAQRVEMAPHQLCLAHL